MKGDTVEERRGRMKYDVRHGVIIESPEEINQPCDSFK